MATNWNLIGGIATSALGLAGSIFGSINQQKQQEAIIQQALSIATQNRNKQIQLAMPYYNAGLTGIRYTNNIVNQMDKERFNNNPLFDQARDTSLSRLNQEKRRSQNSTDYSFGSNQGRARGERNRIGRQYISNQNQIHFDWANQTEADRMKKTQQYLSGVTMLNKMGYTGTNMLSQAYNNYANQSMNLIEQTPYTNTLGTLSPSLMDFGFHLINNDNNRFKNALDEYNSL